MATLNVGKRLFSRSQSSEQVLSLIEQTTHHSAIHTPRGEILRAMTEALELFILSPKLSWDQELRGQGAGIFSGMKVTGL